ncbi:aldose 1-epimerase [Alicyclobacillus sendaiensis]|uniref:Aldose 1-epimerase n=1 Tax=Alicyclobacillus sendaiensis PA2 TaxID=3029425 RepID=A0ABT6XZM2_ALISE|nr:aldose 1-epimerase [Alicyclobacillus sendaiensis]MDI9260467.1 aldose 1-epimerase [Alicyclobacillus sendaiensis PA2]
MPAVETTYGGERAIRLAHGPYEAYLLPGWGNLVALRDTARGFRFLREPEQEMDEFRKAPGRYGIPVLYPPNRYRDGEFTIAGEAYRLPVNEEATHNHLHGFFMRIAWPVVDFGEDEGGAYVEIAHEVGEGHPVYEHWPHTFRFAIRYELSERGLVQRVRIENRGGEPMPVMLGFHTAVNVPFSESSSADACTIQLTIGERWELDERKLPTGRFQPLNENERKMPTGGADPFYEPMDNHYTARPRDGHNRMVLTDARLGLAFVYDVDLKYRHWMVWNNNRCGTFFCPEPQTSMVNAPNMDLPQDVTGLIVLAPGESFSATSRMYVEEVSR